ncbi:MAG: carbohydrate ABC transporter permease [Anaerolineae bacterium]|nr:carbohydrate ABC transporter permease [Anaerolineae bacterium]
MKPLSFSGTAVWLLRLGLAVIFVLPLVWMVAASLYPPGTPLPTSLQLLPDEPTLRNYGRVWQLIPIGRFTLNSLLVVALAVPITLVIASWTGLAMALLPRSHQRFWVLISLAVLMAPSIALWSTRFFIYRYLGWYDTVWALIAPAWMATSPFYVLIFYRAFRRIPGAMYDAARMDGAGVLQLWWLVALPAARPTAVGVAVLSFVFYWGDFISPLLYLRSQSRYTLPVALQLLEQLSRSDWALLMAAAVWATLIPVFIFLLVQPYFALIGQERKK